MDALLALAPLSETFSDNTCLKILIPLLTPHACSAVPLATEYQAFIDSLGLTATYQEKLDIRVRRDRFIILATGKLSIFSDLILNIHSITEPLTHSPIHNASPLGPPTISRW